jgi:hypothetical protein
MEASCKPDRTADQCDRRYRVVAPARRAAGRARRPIRDRRRTWADRGLVQLGAKFSQQHGTVIRQRDVLVQPRRDIQPQARDANQGIALRRVFCLSGPAQAIAREIAVVGGGGHDARSSIRFDLCNLPARQAAIEMLHGKAGRLRQRGNVLHRDAAAATFRRWGLAATGPGSRGRLLRALLHDAGIAYSGGEN